MTKIVYNACYGGFGLSDEAMMRYCEIKGITEETIYGGIYDGDIERTDPVLVQVVEELGDKASGEYAKLRIAELSAGTLYRIDEYDGFEQVCTQDDYAWSVA
jgi:hypothetical protein